MRVFKWFMAASVTACCAAGAAGARALIDDNGPAEMPPASYTAGQYVDSKGCVYIRAGYAGQVEWVPRVSSGRNVMCGYKPTFVPANTVAAKPAAKPAAAPKVAAKPAQAPAPAKTTARRVAAPMPTIANTKTPPKIGKAAPAAKPKATRQPAPGNSPACRGASDLSNRYINNGKGMPVRCGPQPTSPYESGALQILPEGYRAAWKDDRLNPRRGIGTAAGQAQMELVWTDTVPRRLVPRPVAVASTATATMSTKSHPGAPKSEAQGKRYVQVGSFGDAANARATIAELQRLGLPVGVSKTTLKGKPVQVVMAGPFTAPAQLNSALGAVRKAGYRDAFLR